jgi:hypothetical protein
MAQGHALAVRVEEGRHFPRDAGAVFRVAAAFDDEQQSTARSVARVSRMLFLRPWPRAAPRALQRPAAPGAHTRALWPGAAVRLTPVRWLCALPAAPAAQAFAQAGTAPFWGETLAWQVEPERLRRVSATGTGQLKLTGAARAPAAQLSRALLQALPDAACAGPPAGARQCSPPTAQCSAGWCWTGAPPS